MTPEARKLFPGGERAVSALGILRLGSGAANGVGNLELNGLFFEISRG